MEIFAAKKTNQVYGKDVWLPEETMQAVREFALAIKGPITTPVGGGIQSLNVTLRQDLDLYVCPRPVHYYTARRVHYVNQKRPIWCSSLKIQKISMRVLSGQAGTPEVKNLIGFVTRSG